MALTESNLENALPLVARGKVRDLYRIDEQTLLFVATDRISAYDVTLQNGIPQKGQLLTLLTAHWISVLSEAIPDLKTHLISLDLPASIPPHLQPQLRSRSMQVRRLDVFPIEAIVRGYMTGSAWREYTTKGTVHGISVPEGMQEGDAFPEPLYTPSTKAEAGKNDENLHPDQAVQLIGERYAKRIEELALKIYKTARDYALQRGIIIADTKLEFGRDPTNDEVVLVDEVLTPDSSRFWSASGHGVGQAQESLDKQYVRNWLTKADLRGKEGVELPEEVVKVTQQKYKDVFERLVGRRWMDVLGTGQTSAASNQ